MNPPTITPGSNGYLAPLPTPEFGANPWSMAAETDQGLASQGAAQGARTISGLQGQMQALQSQPQNGPYPTYPNAYGIGSQSAFGGESAQAPPAQGSSAPAPSSGYNPWSLQGEANAR